MQIILSTKTPTQLSEWNKVHCVSNLPLIKEVHAPHPNDPMIAFLSVDTTCRNAISIPPSAHDELRAASIFTASVWLSLRLCFTSTCSVIDWHGTSVQTTFQTTDFLGCRQCVRHNEHSMPVPTSLCIIHRKSLLYSELIPVRLIFGSGVSAIVDDSDLCFAMAMQTACTHVPSYGHTLNLIVTVAQALRKAYWPICLQFGRRIDQIHLNMPRENTGEGKALEHSIVL